MDVGESYKRRLLALPCDVVVLAPFLRSMEYQLAETAVFILVHCFRRQTLDREAVRREDQHNEVPASGRFAADIFTCTYIAKHIYMFYIKFVISIAALRI